ncbi:MAG TPA: BTAD domain-containing putative transcriptional regulator [Actinocrinis sp.]|nr:BTAD domain-containing putative transcriptional regulator [Actinocrinis sp.]
MWFEILGPMRVVDRDVTRSVAGVRQRTVLGMLLAHANQPVPGEQLAEIVWDGVPPPGAVATLRTYVMRLRQGLGARVASRVVTRDLGYLIEIDENELDALVFAALCRATGAAVRAYAWADASAAAARALALWRGTPLIDAPSQALHEQWLPRLERDRLQVVEWRIEAELNLGHAEHLVPQLREQTARHPLRERFHAQLMAALALTGRRAEALAAYRDARNVLIDELGVEPGPELQDLHERILAADGVPFVLPDADGSGAAGPGTGPTTGPRTAPGTDAPSIPRQLPSAARYFTGRQAESDLVTGLLEQASATGGTVVISAIDGMAGIGKTALAVHAAHRLAQKFPDGQLFADLHGYTRGHEPRTAGEVLDWFLRTLGVPAERIPKDVEERAALYRQRLADSRTLIVLDNAVSEAQVRPLLPGGAGCLVLVTSRRRLRGLDDTHILSLDVLPQADAVALLRAMAGPDRFPAADPVAVRIAELCGSLPLALRIAASLLRHRPAWSLEHLAELLRDRRWLVTTLSDGERDLGTVFDLSYDGLDEARRLLFRRIGTIPGPDFDAHAAAALTGTEPAAAAGLLEDLVDQSLLTTYAPGRYRLHDLLRAHAHALADQDPAADRQIALDRLLDHYLRTADRADALIARYPRPAADAADGEPPAHALALADPAAAWTWLRAERANLLAVLRHTAVYADHRRTVALTASLATLLRTDGPWADAVALHGTAAELAERLGDRPGRARALIHSGHARFMVGDLSAASRDLHEALALYRDLDDRLGQANALTYLGGVHRLTGDNPGAVHALEEALRLFRDLGNARGQANALNVLGQTRMGIGDAPGAVHDLHEALHLHRELGDQRGEAAILSQLGYARSMIGDYPGAVRDLSEALRLFRDLGNLPGQVATLGMLGHVRGLTHDYVGAIRDSQDGLQLGRDLGDLPNQVTILGQLGNLRRATGDYAGAARDLEEALDLCRRIGARGNEAPMLNLYAALLAETGEHTRAEALHRDALDLARQTHNFDEEARALEGIGECHLYAGDIQAGTAHLEQALDIFDRLALRPDADRVQTRLAKSESAASQT